MNARTPADRSSLPLFLEDLGPGGDALKQALALHYRIEAVLGRGGMGVVYRAFDVRHDRLVAIKVVRPELSASITAERFSREIKLTSQLQHPNILPLYDSGEAAGFLYYVMPFIAGESLRSRLEREQELPIEEAVEIGRAIARGLSYAHAHNVVHRDIKPENILLDGERPILADFGLGRALEAGDGSRLTATGLVVGTPSYMSPEQADSAARIDGRSDVYSLACVLYELLAGVPPFQGGSAQMVIARHAVDPVPPIRTVRPAVTPALEAAILKALEKRPADRHRTAAEFEAALAASVSAAQSPALTGRRVALAAMALLLLAAAGALWQFGPLTGSANASLPVSVAVLPCETRDGTGDSGRVADRWTEELIYKLVRVAGLQPKSISSVQRFRGSPLPPRAIGKALNAGTLVRCVVDEAAHGLNLDVQFIRAATEEVVWANKYLAPSTLEGINRTQTVVAEDVARLTGVTIAPERQQLVEKPLTTDTAALRLYRLGSHLMADWRGESRVSSLERAIELFEAAVQRDSSFARAHAALGEAMFWRGERLVIPTREFSPAAARRLQKAVSLDPGLSEAHSWLAMYLADYSHDWAGADEAHRKALAANPASADARLWYGYHLRVLGDREGAIRELERATTLDPTSVLALRHLIAALMRAGFAERARSLTLDGLKLHPKDEILQMLLARQLIDGGRRDDSVLSLLSRSVRAGPVGYLYAAAGRPDLTRKILDSMYRSAESRDVDYVHLATLQGALGAVDTAVRLLEAAYADRSMLLVHNLGDADPWLDPLREHPRFIALRRKVGFPDPR